MLPVTIISGYLGAGKTTLVNQLLRQADGLRLAVLVNEFGALPIDEDLIEAQNDTMISIAGGCVCCSYGNDLIQAMMDLSGLDVRPDHILIESSGVAMPDAIAASVSIMDGFHVDGVVVLADGETIREQANNAYIGDTIERQLQAADLVLLNKIDLVEPGHLEALTSWVRTNAPNAEVIPVSHADLPNAVVLQRFDRDELATLADFHPHADAFESRVLYFDDACDAEAVAQKLADPALGLIRAKGFVATPKGMRAVHTVGRRWSVTDAPKGATAGVVVIAEKKEPSLFSLSSVFECGE